jgi:glycosyltransferase involved in cell wall biosynthesis
VIVVDDGSVDDTARIVRSFATVLLLAKENGGSASAKNYGAARATGEYLYFLDADVLIATDTITLLVETARSHGVAMVVGRYSTEPANSGFIHHYKALVDYVLYIPRKNRDRVTLDCQIGGGGELYDRQAFQALGGFAEKYRGASVEREELIIRLYRQGYHSAANPFITTRHYFPGFREVVANYVWRIYETMKLLQTNDIKFSYISPEKAILAPMATFACLVLLVAKWFLPRLPGSLLLLSLISMLFLQREIIWEGVRRKGLAMGLGIFLLHLFICLVIFLSGVLSFLVLSFRKAVSAT